MRETLKDKNAPGKLEEMGDLGTALSFDFTDISQSSHFKGIAAAVGTTKLNAIFKERAEKLSAGDPAEFSTFADQMRRHEAAKQARDSLASDPATKKYYERIASNEKLEGVKSVADVRKMIDSSYGFFRRDTLRGYRQAAAEKIFKDIKEAREAKGQLSDTLAMTASEDPETNKAIREAIRNRISTKSAESANPVNVREFVRARAGGESFNGMSLMVLLQLIVSLIQGMMAQRQQPEYAI